VNATKPTMSRLMLLIGAVLRESVTAKMPITRMVVPTASSRNAPPPAVEVGGWEGGEDGVRAERVALLGHQVD
jgi:hypothetical protein